MVEKTGESVTVRVVCSHRHCSRLDVGYPERIALRETHQNILGSEVGPYGMVRENYSVTVVALRETCLGAER